MTITSPLKIRGLTSPARQSFCNARVDLCEDWHGESLASFEKYVSQEGWSSVVRPWDRLPACQVFWSTGCKPIPRISDGYVSNGPYYDKWLAVGSHPHFVRHQLGDSLAAAGRLARCRSSFS